MGGALGVGLCAPEAGALGYSFLPSLISIRTASCELVKGPKAPRSSQESATTSLNTELGTSKSTKAMQVPSEATPGKRDMAFDIISHNPMSISST
jgi:hypothetical protein